ncbi:MAG: hypothetical protein JSW40_09475, partial [Candidatus Omnitrophota bacterium]
MQDKRLLAGVISVSILFIIFALLFWGFERQGYNNGYTQGLKQGNYDSRNGKIYNPTHSFRPGRSLLLLMKRGGFAKGYKKGYIESYDHSIAKEKLESKSLEERL